MVLLMALVSVVLAQVPLIVKERQVLLQNRDQPKLSSRGWRVAKLERTQSETLEQKRTF